MENNNTTVLYWRKALVNKKRAVEHYMLQWLTFNDVRLALKNLLVMLTIGVKSLKVFCS